MNQYLALTIVTITEATIGVFVKLVGDNVPILSLNFYRVFFAALLLAAAMPFFNRSFWKFPKRNFKDTFIIGALIATQICIFNIAMTLAPIANVVIFWSISPFFAFIFSRIFLKEPTKKEHVFIFLIAILGVAIAEPISNNSAHTLGNLISLGSGVVYAALVTYMRHEGKTEENSDIFWSITFAALILLPGLLISGPGKLFKLLDYSALPFDVPVIAWVIALGVFSTGLAYLFISVAIKKISANIYSLVDTVVSPIIAAFFGFLAFGEVPSSNMVYGGILLIISGFWLTQHMRKKSIEPVTVNK